MDDKFLKYEVRNEALSQLGYSSYAEYLKSEDWKIIRASIMEEFKLCVLCDSPSQVVHHIKYDSATLLGLRKHCLIALCHKCHQLIEMNGKEKRTLEGANQILFAMIYKFKTNSSDVWFKKYTDAKKSEKKSGFNKNVSRSDNKCWKSILAKKKGYEYVGRS